MKNYLKTHMRHLLSQVPIVLVLLDLHIEGIEGLDKAESQRHLSKGNQLLHAGQLADALIQYHAAIDTDETNYQAFYMRATVYLAMGKARSALPDLNQVVILQPTFVKARLQRGNLFLKMGKFNEAQGDYEAVLAHEENDAATKKVEEIRPLRRNVIKAYKLIETNDNAQAITLLTEVIESCPWNPDFRELRATAYERMGDLRKAISDLKPTTMLRLDNTQAYYKMSVLWYSLGEVEQSLDEIRECLKLDPDHSECFAHYKSVKKLYKTIDAAKKLMAQNNWPDAIAKYEKALVQESRVQFLSVELKLKICECYVKWNRNYPDALSACLRAIRSMTANDLRAAGGFVLLSHLHVQLGRYKTAVDDLRKALEIDENYPGLQEKMKTAQKLLKQSQKRDYYKILGVPRNAVKKDVIKAYRRLAREWHPDNFQDEEEKKIAEKKFIEIAAAKEVLTDPDKIKILHDGYDPLDADDVTEWENERASGTGENVFKFFFQNAGGPGRTVHQKPFEDLFRSFQQHKQQFTEDADGGDAREREARQRQAAYGPDDSNRRRGAEEERHQRDRQQQQQQKQQWFTRGRDQQQGRQRQNDFTRQPHAGARETFREDATRDDASRVPPKENFGDRRHQNEGAARGRKDYQTYKGQSSKQFDDPSDRGTRAQDANARADRRSSSKKKKKSESFRSARPTKKDKEEARRYTQGTDGKWYYKNKSGRWEVHDGPPPHTRKKEKESKPSASSDDDKRQSPNKEIARYTDENGNVFVRGSDGNWYMRVKPPTEDDEKSRGNAESKSSRNTGSKSSRKERPEDRASKSDRFDEEFPRGLFLNGKNEISDQIGNIYEKQSNGRFAIIKLSAKGKARLKERLQRQKVEHQKRVRDEKRSRQRRQDEDASSAKKRRLFKDAMGNVFMKDAHGNLIKIRKEDSGDEETRKFDRWEEEEDEEDEEDFDEERGSSYFQQRSGPGHQDRRRHNEEFARRERTYHRGPAHEEL